MPSNGTIEEKREYQRRWREKNRAKVTTYNKEYQPKYVEKNRDKINAYCRARWKESYARQRDVRLAGSKRRNVELRKTIIGFYSQDTFKCNCCSEDVMAFLTIDHIVPCTKDDRKKQGSGNAFYRWLLNNNFPSGFQVLCYNCNYGKRDHLECPHKRMPIE